MFLQVKTSFTELEKMFNKVIGVLYLNSQKLRNELLPAMQNILNIIKVWGSGLVLDGTCPPPLLLHSAERKAAFRIKCKQIHAEASPGTRLRERDA